MASLQVHIVLEILGRPSENVKDALSLLVSKLGAESGIKILESKFHDPVPIKDVDLYTAFVELTLEVETLEKYLLLLFTYMPSHSELVYPEKLLLENRDLNQVTALLLQRLHQYDAIAKKLVVERDILLKKVQKEAPQLLQPMKVTSLIPEKKRRKRKLGANKVRKKKS